MGETKTLTYELSPGTHVNNWEIYWGRMGRPPYDEMVSSAAFDAGWEVVVNLNDHTVTITPPTGVAASNNYVVYVEESSGMVGERLFGVSN